MALFLGNGEDFFSVTTQTPAFGNGSSVFGENGDDTILIGSGGPHDAIWRDLIVDGGNGDDIIRMPNALHNTLVGRNGADTLVVAGGDNQLDGGNGDDSLSSSIKGSFGNYLNGGGGDDVLSSFTGPSAVLLRGDIMTGGPGSDTFNFNTGPNFSALKVTNDTNGVVSGGDIVTGDFAVITDYTPDDRLVLGTTTAYEGPIALDADGHMSFPGGYTTIRGEFDPLAATQFTVDTDGTDLLVVFDLPAIHPPGYYGSVVLENYTQSDITVIA